MTNPHPTIHFLNRQKSLKTNSPLIQSLLQKAIPLALRSAHPGSPITTLPSIEITLVTDHTISRIHKKFLHDPSPTDVITFHHGDILLGAQTIAANAASHSSTFENEILLCSIHGLLHLGNWHDNSPAAARKMSQRQTAILYKILHPSAHSIHTQPPQAPVSLPSP